MAIHKTDVIEAFHSERKEQKNGKTSWLVAMHRRICHLRCTVT